jgi:hypothetical protein
VVDEASRLKVDEVVKVPGPLSFEMNLAVRCKFI